MIHKNALTAFLLAASSASSVSGFAPPCRTARSSAPTGIGTLTSNDLTFTSPPVVADVGTSSTALASGLELIDVLVPSALFGSAVLATVKYSEKEESALADVITKKKGGDSDSKSSTKAKVETKGEKEETEEEEAKEETKAAADGERKYEFTTPAAKREKEAAASAPAPEPVPAPAPASAPKPAEKDISQIRNEVASTLDSRKEMQKRLDEAKAERSKSQPPAISEEQEKEGDDEEDVEPTEEASADSTETGKKRQFVGKFVKKVVMPWKKWSNL